MNKKIEDVDFVVFDVETTGLQPKAGDRIIEIAAIRYRDGKNIDSFSSLINPQRKISQAAFQVNHISQSMIDSAPDASAVLPRFLDFTGDGCIAGYNVGFDLGFLENELKMLSIELPSEIAAVDVMQMSRRLIPNIQRHSLAYVSEYLAIQATQEHRALSDCHLTVEVFRRLLKKIKTKGVDSFLQFYNLFGLNQKIIENTNNQHISAIQQAMDLGVRLKLKYFSSSSGEITIREVEPKEIRQQGKSLYLIGYCHLRRDERTFRISSILNIEIV